MNPNVVPGVQASTEYGFRRIMASGQPVYLPGGITIDGSKSRDPLHTGYLDTLRAGLLIGRISLSRKYAPAVLGRVTAAYDGSTSLKIGSPTAVEILRRLGATGTFKLTGPPATGGTVRTLTATYSAVSATLTGQNEVQTSVLAVAGTAGTFRLRVPKADGTKVWTAAIAYNASAATISTAIDTATGVTAGIVCTGTTPFSTTNTGTFTFSGTGYATKSFDPIEVDGASLTSYAGVTIARTTAGCAYETATVTGLGVAEVQTITASAAPTVGSWYVRYRSDAGVEIESAAMAFNADAATIQTAIRATHADLAAVTVTDSGSAGLSDGTVTVTWPTTGTTAGPHSLLNPFAKGDLLATAVIVSLTCARSATGVNGDFAVGSLVQPVDGSETIRGILDMEGGLKVTDVDGTNLNVECRRLIVGSGSGVVDASQIIDYPTEATVQAWIKAALRAVGSGYTFDDDLAA